MTPEESAELSRLEELEKLFDEGAYSPWEMPGQYALWLSTTKSPAQWWPQLPERVREGILSQLRIGPNGILVGGEPNYSYPARLERLAHELGFPWSH